MDVKDSPLWIRLSYVSCASNGLVLMDESLQLLPAVETLDLSRNRFAKVDNLRKCTKLRNLDLGFNHLRSVSSLSEVCSRVGKLVLRNNALTAIHGIENLKSLVGLDLSYNIISNFSELEILGSLSLLQNLWLEGNPICCARWYRARVFSLFYNSENLKLDDKGMNTQEYWEKQVLFASRQKLPAGYGFYFPAKDDHEDEETSNSMMKKISRLACIVEEERSLCDEGVDQQSSPRDSASSKKDEAAAADNDIKITSLISTAELMKKERSTDWLREFKEWMDEHMENTEGDSLYVDFSNRNGRQHKQIKREKMHMESSKSVTELAKTSEGGSSSNLLESELSFTEDTCNGANGITTESLNEVNGDKIHLKVHLNSVLQLPPLEFVGTPHSGSFSEVEGTAKMHTNGTHSSAISELIEPSPSFAYPSPQSPPQYKEDILRCRLFLEEEFLQSSGDFQCVASGGSDSSCSDDSSGDLCSCNSEDECIAVQTKMERALSGQMASFPYADSGNEEMDGMEVFAREDNLSDSMAEDDPTFTDAMEFGIKEPDHRNQRKGHLGQDSGHLVRQNGKQKFMKWILPTFKNRNGTKLGFLKTNGGEVDEGISVGANGHLSYDLTSSTSCKDQISKKHNSNILHKNNLSIGADTVSCNADRNKYKLIEDFFNMEVANNEESEICEQGACCGYMFQDGSNLVQREVALLRSSQNKLYVLLVDMAQDEEETMPRVLGCYRLEDLEKVMIGLGIQAVRVHMADDTAHLFLTRTSKEAQDVLWLLNLFSFPQLTSGVSLQSWEMIQVKLLEKCICASLKMGIFLYSMLMFCNNDAEEESLVVRSLVVTEGSIFVCIENLYQFGCFPDDSHPPYFSLDECCSINSIKEVVVDQHDKKCLTLVLDKHVHEGNSHSSTRNSQSKQADEICAVHTWKLKWFAEDTLLKFISVLKALYSAAAATSTLPVKCIS